MENKKVISLSSMVFFLLLGVSIPLHIDSTNHIVEKQKEEGTISGFFYGEERDTRFRPREYIHSNTIPREFINVE